MTGNTRLRSAVALAFPKHPADSFGKVPDDRGAAMSLSRIQPLIEQADMLLAA